MAGERELMGGLKPVFLATVELRSGILKIILGGSSPKLSDNSNGTNFIKFT